MERETPRDLRRRLVGDARAPADLTVLQWNLLADWATTSTQKSGTASPACLSWAGRRERILALLADGLPEPADVLCLQEVDHHEDLFAALRASGYDAHFEPKQSGNDGCALLVRRERFEVEALHRRAYRAPRGRDAWSQVALFADLRARADGRQVQVATTHLKAKPGNEAVRSAQVGQLLDALADDRPVVVAGDFNDVPASDACARMRARPLKDACRAVLGRDLSWTTWKYQLGHEKKRTIDYIWHTPETLRPLACLALPDDDEVEPARFPSWQYPSDHVSLVARFAWG